MRNEDTILLIGGMGPQASIKLHELIISKSSRHTNGSPEKFPTILHASLPFPLFTSNSSNEKRAIKMINTTLLKLNANSMQSISFACNTAHKLVDDLNINENNFVSMIEAVKNEIEIQSLKKIGLLASPTTLQSRLYHEPLESIGCSILTPTKEDMDVLENVIHAVIEGTESLKILKLKLTKLAQNLIDNGAEAILLGCTELPLIGVSVNVPVIDSLNALANELVNRHFANKV